MEQPASPLVTVCIPAHNAARHIGATLKSVSEQSYRQLEIIVVDDGSTDDTCAIVMSAARADARIRLLCQKNQGVAVARNLAIHYSRGEYIAPLDADDLWFPEKIEKQVQCIGASPASVGLVYAWSVNVSEGGARLGHCGHWEAEGRVLMPLLFRNFLGSASVPLIKRGVFDEVGAYDPLLRAQHAQGCEDWDLYLRIAEKYDYRVVPEHLVGYRNVKGSMSGDFTAMSRSYQLVISRVLQRHPEVPRRVVQWSAAMFFLYLLTKSHGVANYRACLHWHHRAMKADPQILISRSLNRLYVISVVKLALKPLFVMLWPQAERRVRVRRKMRVLRWRLARLLHLRRRRKKEHLDLYDRILERRWKMLLTQNSGVQGPGVRVQG
ncbi:MAG TPA: glycosyltransferase family A protein [Planctomycetota bacterium]|jgi:glycosyltransferase involved in cell wall biosynthesis